MARMKKPKVSKLDKAPFKGALTPRQLGVIERHYSSDRLDEKLVRGKTIRANVPKGVIKGWKWAVGRTLIGGEHVRCFVLVRVEIPRDASVIRPIKVQTRHGNEADGFVLCNKYRTNKAVVTGAWRLAPGGVVGDKYTGNITAHFRSSFQYKVGDTIQPNETMDVNVYEDCASGIHFFTGKGAKARARVRSFG